MTNINKWSQGDGSKERRSGANSDPPNNDFFTLPGLWISRLHPRPKLRSQTSQGSSLMDRDGCQTVNFTQNQRPACSCCSNSWPFQLYSITHQWTHYVDWNGVTGTGQSSRSWRLIWRSRSLATFAVQLCFADRNADQTTRISTHLRTLSIPLFFVWFWKGSWSENRVAKSI